MNFKEVMEKNDINDDFIAALLPKKPIPITDTIRPLLGQVHPNTEPALNMLKEEGFEFTHEIDILDGGPRIECKIDKIKTIVNSEVITVYDFLDSQPEKTEFIISTVSNDFRVCLGNAYGGLIDKTTAALLNIKKGDAVRIAPLHNKI
jgi:arginine N-succinyltransferase